MMSTKIITAPPINRVMLRGDMGYVRTVRKSRRHPRQSKANRWRSEFLVVPGQAGRFFAVFGGTGFWSARRAKENSPAIHRWVWAARSGRVPEGRQESRPQP